MKEVFFQVNVELQWTKLTMFEVVLLGTFDVAVFILLLLVSLIWTIRVLQCKKGWVYTLLCFFLTSET